MKLPTEDGTEFVMEWKCSWSNRSASEGTWGTISLPQASLSSSS